MILLVQTKISVLLVAVSENRSPRGLYYLCNLFCLAPERSAEDNRPKEEYLQAGSGRVHRSRED